MIGWPTFSPCRSTSTTKFGDLWVPNWWLKMLMQELPHDGVAAAAPPAVSAPVTPTPPTRVSVAAAASTLLLMDIGENSSLGTRSHTLRTAAPSWPRSTRRILARSLGTLPAHGWPDQDRNGRPDRSCSLEREKTREALRSVTDSDARREAPV